MKWAFGFLGLLLLFSFGIDFVPGLNAQRFDPSAVLEPQAPSFSHPLGTDDVGRDLAVRCLSGAKISLAVGFVSVFISSAIGLLVGLFSGYSKSWLDEIIMRVVDFWMAIPTFFLILSIQVLLKPSIWNVITVIGVTSWMGTARMVRAQTLSIKQRPFILAAKARGFSKFRLLFIHVLPHTLQPVIVASMMGMGYAILTESVLSFLGLGVQPPYPSWGNILEKSLNYLHPAPWMAMVPGMFIMVTVLSIAWISDQLRKKLDPQ